MLVYCFGSFLLQDLFLSLQVFAFKGQNVNMLLSRFLYCGGPAMICESMAAQFLTSPKEVTLEHEPTVCQVPYAQPTAPTCVVWSWGFNKGVLCV